MATPPRPSVLVIYGATGDLMARKIAPSLFYLHNKGLLPERLEVVGFGRRPWGDAEFRDHVRGILADTNPDADTSAVEEFLGYFCYYSGQFADTSAFVGLGEYLRGMDERWGECSDKVFYLAVPPNLYPLILKNLAESELTTPCSDLEGWTRVLVEKPFGDDEESSRELDKLLRELFKEEQIYRIDHYLAKEMLQGIMNFRFSNNLFETSWSRDAVESIDVDLLESVGIDGRGAFYDGVGALRDVGQNHLLQMLALVTMDRPASPRAQDVRAARAEAISTLLRPMTAVQVAADTFRAQHDGYRDISGVASDSETETYFMLRALLHGPRWAGVPVTMQSGKAIGEPLKRIVVRFKHPEECFCAPGQRTNTVVFSLEPSDTIDITFYAKKPGFTDETEERTFRFFLYEKTEKLQYVEEYGRLLHDAMLGDQMLFVSSEEVEAGWRFIDSVVEAWHERAVPLEKYAPGSSEAVGRALEKLSRTSTAKRGAVGVVGLGKMGSGLARNLIEHGWRTVGWNRHGELAEAMRGEGLEPAASFEELATELPKPRVIWMMLPAGPAVDGVIFGHDGQPGLVDFLEPGDVIVDGGNSHYTDAPIRSARLAEKGVGYLDCGTSGGPEGARHGACLMIGGGRADFERLEPMFADVAAPSGYGYFGPHGAGHFVKMVHNGIEYGMVQAIAEGFAIMHEGVRIEGRPAARLDLERVADVYQHQSVVESRLVGWARDAFSTLGDDLEGVSGIVGHTGEGEWTIAAARAVGVEVPIIEASLRFRVESEHAPTYTGQVLTALRNAFGGHGIGPAGGPRT